MLIQKMLTLILLLRVYLGSFSLIIHCTLDKELFIIIYGNIIIRKCCLILFFTRVDFLLIKHVQGGWVWCTWILRLVSTRQLGMEYRLQGSFRPVLCWLQKQSYKDTKIFCSMVQTCFREKTIWDKLFRILLVVSLLRSSFTIGSILW